MIPSWVIEDVALAAGILSEDDPSYYPAALIAAALLHLAETNAAAIYSFAPVPVPAERRTPETPIHPLFPETTHEAQG